MTKKKLPLLPRVDRVCGGCNACCYVLAIDDLKKPINEDCKHLDRSKTTHHCSIYAERPRDCSEYMCAWVREPWFGEDKHRPDRLGVVFTPRDNRWDVEPFAGPFSLVGHELRAGAMDEKVTKKFMTHLAGHFIVFGFFAPTFVRARTMGPENKMQAVFNWCEEHGHQVTDILKNSKPPGTGLSRSLVE